MPRGQYARKAKRTTNVYPINFPRNPDVAGALTEDTTVSVHPNKMDMKDQIAMQNIELLTLRNANALLETRAALYERLLDRLSR